MTVEQETALIKLIETAERALPFIGPRVDYAGRTEGSLSEQIRSALIRADIIDAIAILKEGVN